MRRFLFASCLVVAYYVGGMLGGVFSGPIHPTPLRNQPLCTPSPTHICVPTPATHPKLG